MTDFKSLLHFRILSLYYWVLSLMSLMSSRKPQVSIKSQTGVMAKKKEKKGGNGGVLGEVHVKTPGFYQVPKWSNGQKTQEKGGNRGLRGVWGGLGWRGGAGGMQGFWGEVHAKTPGLYQVPNWSYGQKTQKKGEMGGKYKLIAKWA